MSCVLARKIYHLKQDRYTYQADGMRNGKPISLKYDRHYALYLESVETYNVMKSLRLIDTSFIALFPS